MAQKLAAVTARSFALFPVVPSRASQPLIIIGWYCGVLNPFRSAAKCCQ